MFKSIHPSDVPTASDWGLVSLGVIKIINPLPAMSGQPSEATQTVGQKQGSNNPCFPVHAFSKIYPGRAGG